MRRPSDPLRGMALALAATALAAITAGACGDDGARAPSDRKTPAEACEGLAPCDFCITEPGCGSEEGGACPDEHCTAEGLCEVLPRGTCDDTSTQTTGAAGGGDGQGGSGSSAASGAGPASGPSGTGGGAGGG